MGIDPSEAAKLRAIRQATGMTTADVAAASGVDEYLIDRFEMGLVGPDETRSFAMVLLVLSDAVSAGLREAMRRRGVDL